MAARNGGENKEFLEFLRNAPSLEDAASGATTELTGLVSRTTEGRFAITTGEGQTYEFDTAAVRRFRVTESPGLSPVATIQVASDVLREATLRPLKPIIKDVVKDPIKDIIHDGGGGGTPFAKDIQTDPVIDKHIIKDIHKDTPFDTVAAKDVRTDPAIDKHVFKDIHKDPPFDTGLLDVAGTGFGDPGNIPDPTGQVTNPAFGQFAGAAGMQAMGMQAAGMPQAGMMPFVMATPHQAPPHLVALQAGMPQAAALAGGAQLKPFAQDPNTLKEVAWAETIKEPVRDTAKEMIRDTYKEMVWETWQEGVFDPSQVFTQPGFGTMGFM